MVEPRHCRSVAPSKVVRKGRRQGLRRASGQARRLAAVGTWLVVLPSALASCASRPPVPHLAPEVGAMTVRVELPEVRYLNEDCQEKAGPVGSTARKMQAGIARELDRVGMRWVTEPDSQSDLLIHSSFDVSCGYKHLTVRSSYVLRGDGKHIANDGGEGDCAYDTYPDSLSAWVLRPLLGSVELERFAKHRTAARHDTKADGVATASESPATPRPVGTPKAKPAVAVAGLPRRNAFALAIGIERYKRVPAADGSAADARRFVDLAKTTLGVPADHVRLLTNDDATKADIEIEWLVSSVGPQGRIYLFYSGHGAPEPTSGTSYLLPYNGRPDALETSAHRLDEVVATLSKSKAQEVVALVDACFSGSGGRSVLAKGVKPLVRVQQPKAATRVALLTAATGGQISGTNATGKQGLFTDYLWLGLARARADRDGDGTITLAELHRYLQPRVEREAKSLHRDQRPNLVLGAGLASDHVVLAAGLLTE